MSIFSRVFHTVPLYFKHTSTQTNLLPTKAIDQPIQRYNKIALFIGLLIAILSIFVMLINYFFYHYPGNNYFPPHTTFIGVNLFLIYTGLYLQFGFHSKQACIMREIIFFFLVMSAIALASNAVQLTPFSPIDQKLIDIESFLPINTEILIRWTQQNPYLFRVFTIAYGSLAWQMCYLPMLIIFSRRFYLLHEYFFLMLVSALIGFSLYYFFPTTAPASMLHHNVFSTAQQATYLKFQQIHQNIAPTTVEGGLIAFPSFHVIWAWFCLYLIREWRYAFYVLAPWNGLLIMSCVLLGWHYISDVIASFLIIAICHWLYVSTNHLSALKRSPY